MRKMKRTVMTMAVVMCLAIIFQNGMSVKAASVKRELMSCPICHNLVDGPTRTSTHITFLERTGDCPDRSHVSLGCYICTVHYEETYTTECCGKILDEYVFIGLTTPNQHSAMVKQ